MVPLILSLCVLPASTPPIVPDGSKFEWIFKDVDFAEGAAAGVDGAIYFSDIPTGPKSGRILRYSPEADEVQVWVQDSHKSNGIYVDSHGRLVVCEGADHGGRCIARYTRDRQRTVLVDNYQGKRFNAPNDICVDRRGWIWFSDPKYLGDEPRELAHRSLYRLDSSGKLNLALTQPRIQKPNGVHVSADGNTLYVADTNNHTVEKDGEQVPGNMMLKAFVIEPTGEVGKQLWEYDFAPTAGVDGMTLDTQGRIYAAVRIKENPRLAIFLPTGKLIETISLPDVPTNCVFGRGDNRQTLFITTDTGFGKIRLNATGYHLENKTN